MAASLMMFLVFIAVTLGITYWASRRSAGASAYFAAGRQIKSWQNGVAVAGDYGRLYERRVVPGDRGDHCAPGI